MATIKRYDGSDFVPVGVVDNNLSDYVTETAANDAYLSRDSVATIDVTAAAYGALGDDTTDDQPAIQAALDAAAALAVTAGSQVRVFVPPSTSAYRCNAALTVPSNILLENRGHLKFYGGNAIGGFILIEDEENIEIMGGVFDSNSQGNDNTIAISNGDVATQQAKNIRVHDLTIKNALHDRTSGGGDATDPTGVGSGGGKGVTVQFGCQDVFVSDVLIEDCSIGFSVEGKLANDGEVQSVHFNNVIVRNATYMGCLLWGYIGTPFIDQMHVDLTNVSFYECASGQTIDASPQDVSDLFGVITCNGATAVKAKDVRVYNSTGQVTVLRGPQRSCEWDLHVVVNDLVDFVNSAPYGGHLAQTLISRYCTVRGDLTILGAAFTGYIVNNDATYPLQYSAVDVHVLDYNNASPAELSKSQYATGFPTTSLFQLHDKHSGRTVSFNDGADLTADVAGVEQWINGIGFDDSSAAAQSKLVASRTNLGLAGLNGSAQVTVADAQTTVKNNLFHSGSQVAFYGVGLQSRQTVAAAASDAATTQALANSLRTILVNLGLAQT